MAVVSSSQHLATMLVSFLLLVISMTVIAEETFPAEVENVEKTKEFFPGCQEVGHDFRNGNLVLTPIQVEAYSQTIFFLHNTSYERIKVKYDHDNGNPLYPLWEVSIKPNRWVSFATDKRELGFKCYEDFNFGHGDEINCGSVLQVCQFPRSKFGEHNKGNYWIPSNKPKYQTRNDAIRYGILLRW